MKFNAFVNLRIGILYLCLYIHLISFSPNTCPTIIIIGPEQHVLLYYY